MKYSNIFDTGWSRYLIMLLLFPFLAQDLLFELPVFLQKSRADNLAGTTTGRIVSITPDSTLHQTVDGNRIVLQGYKVKYSFTYNNETFFGETYINNGTTQRGKVQRMLFESKDDLTIKYNPNKPEINTIATSYEDIFLSM
ncbi:hypothetical protein [Chondrinema litorale]|uniref:hypothetical protein n=1 Tax=Chondrinema litorale TaxID=2994555 RepID=UPI002542FC3A|nr:hypothetical protein [Chondrinema litorale]UZR94964.1 hypothetical protein OQ292_03940 [Chondrinema litorale]